MLIPPQRAAPQSTPPRFATSQFAAQSDAPPMRQSTADNSSNGNTASDSSDGGDVDSSGRRSVLHRNFADTNHQPAPPRRLDTDQEPADNTAAPDDRTAFDDGTPPEQKHSTTDSPGHPGGRPLEGAQCPQLTIQKLAPAEVQVGKATRFEIRVRNSGTVTAQDVEIRDEVPHGTRLAFDQTCAATAGPHGERDLVAGGVAARRAGDSAARTDAGRRGGNRQHGERHLSGGRLGAHAGHPAAAYDGSGRPQASAHRRRSAADHSHQQPRHRRGDGRGPVGKSAGRTAASLGGRSGIQSRHAQAGPIAHDRTRPDRRAGGARRQRVASARRRESAGSRAGRVGCRRPRPFRRGHRPDAPLSRAAGDLHDVDLEPSARPRPKMSSSSRSCPRA